MVSVVIGFPSRRSEPVRHHVVLLVAASVVSSSFRLLGIGAQTTGIL